jgi:hypothetical protein
VGAADGNLIRIEKPGWSGSLYFNYKHYCSVALLAVADSNFHFIYADAGSYGKDSDASIFWNCFLVAKTSAQAITYTRQTSGHVHSETLQHTVQLLTSVVAWLCKPKMWRALQSTDVSHVVLSVQWLVKL